MSANYQTLGNTDKNIIQRIDLVSAWKLIWFERARKSKQRSKSWQLTEILIIGLDLGREERRAGHGLLDAHHLVWLVANQPGRDTVIALLYSA